MEIDKWDNLQNFRNLAMFNVAWKTLFHHTIEWKVLKMANEENNLNDNKNWGVQNLNYTNSYLDNLEVITNGEMKC
jgi:hypothetical protein